MKDAETIFVEYSPGDDHFHVTFESGAFKSVGSLSAVQREGARRSEEIGGPVFLEYHNLTKADKRLVRKIAERGPAIGIIICKRPT